MKNLANISFGHSLNLDHAKFVPLSLELLSNLVCSASMFAGVLTFLGGSSLVQKTVIQKFRTHSSMMFRCQIDPQEKIKCNRN